MPILLLCPTAFLTTQRSQMRSRPLHDVYRRPVKLNGDLALNLLLIGMPLSKAAASVNSLKVEPAWYPWIPPIAGSAARFQYVSPFLALLPISGRLCAMAMIRPVPGWIMFMVEI